MTVGFYSIFLKETVACSMNYGKTRYDFDDWSVVSLVPEQTFGYTTLEGVPLKSKGLLFHPDFIRGTSLGQRSSGIRLRLRIQRDTASLTRGAADLNCMSIIRTELQPAGTASPPGIPRREGRTDKSDPTGCKLALFFYLYGVKQKKTWNQTTRNSPY